MSGQQPLIRRTLQLAAGEPFPIGIVFDYIYIEDITSAGGYETIMVSTRSGSEWEQPAGIAIYPAKRLDGCDLHNHNAGDVIVTICFGLGKLDDHRMTLVGTADMNLQEVAGESIGTDPNLLGGVPVIPRIDLTKALSNVKYDDIYLPPGSSNLTWLGNPTNYYLILGASLKELSGIPGNTVRLRSGTTFQEYLACCAGEHVTLQHPIKTDRDVRIAADGGYYGGGYATITYLEF